MSGSKFKLFEGFWSVKDCDSEPNSLFVFGDNDARIGCRGQSVIRDCENSFGIPTKKFPSFSTSSYYTDDEYDLNVVKIEAAFEELVYISRDYEIVYFPENGLGTGLAKLSEKAPKTFEYLKYKIDEMQDLI